MSTQRSDSKQAEKRYLSRTGGREWELEKPFAPAGSESFDDSVDLLHDFAVAMRILQPWPDDLILDLGGGGGWSSDLMQRLHRHSVCVDIAHEMLSVARQRPTRAPLTLVAADMERLPFGDGSFDKAVCLNALHHVPDMEAAIAEISRVLRSDGVAVFSEPGEGHGETATSRKAVHDFGVLEQEVLIEPFIEMCLRSGFRHAYVCPMAYVIPEFELTSDEWAAWRRLGQSKRPVRAVQKMWRALLELTGFGKGTVLFEEAFAMRLVRLLKQPVQGHPFLVATKSDVRRRPHPVYRARIDVSNMPGPVAGGQAVTLRIKVTNTGDVSWRRASDSGRGHVRVGLQLLDSERRMSDASFGRWAFPRDVPPQADETIDVHFAAPEQPGEYHLKIDLVAEGITWFETANSPVVVLPLRVRSDIA